MVIATACLFVHGCDTVEGGAVELSWKLRPASSDLADKFVDCRSGQSGTNPVTKMRLEWSVRTDDNEVVTGSDEWPCDDSHGVTGFALPAGTALLSVKPVCGPITREFDAVPGSYVAPAAEQRRVSLGDTISLGAVELVVVVRYCPDQSCICECHPDDCDPPQQSSGRTGSPIASLGGMKDLPTAASKAASGLRLRRRQP